MRRTIIFILAAAFIALAIYLATGRWRPPFSEVRPDGFIQRPPY